MNLGSQVTHRCRVDREELVELYVRQHLTSIQIAERLGTTYSTILRRLAAYGIPVTSVRDVRRGCKCSDETRCRMATARRGNQTWVGRHHSDDTKAKLRGLHLGTSLPTTTRERMSATHRRLFENPEHKQRILAAMAMGTRREANRKELIVLDALNTVQPNEWEFVGDRKLNIGGRYPDFINRKRKLLCEHFGVYWHGPRARNDLEREHGRVQLFASCGYPTLVIWENELAVSRRSLLLEKVRDFVGGY